MARKSLSSVDTAWLRMEEPNNLMMITGVLVFGAPIEYDRLKATLEARSPACGPTSPGRPLLGERP
jgi:hypothetical protein